MKRFMEVALAGLLTGCQAPSVERDISTSITDPALRAQFAEDYQQRQVALAAMATRCRSQWSGDPSMIAYCEETQTPAVRRYVSNQVRFKHMNKGGLFEKQYRAHLTCRAAYPGDFQMAQACVDNEAAVRHLVVMSQ